MAEPKLARSRLQLRALLRAIHRDVGYLAVGLTLIYAVSGIAVNHIADWDPSFDAYERTHELGPLSGDDKQVAAAAAARLDIEEKPREIYRVSPDQLDVLYERRTLHVDAASGRVLDEGQEPRLFFRLANWLHLNRGKKAWTYAADTYAGALLFLSVSGLFMLKGRKGFFGRGVILVLLGVSVPVLYVTLAGGP
jgi:uncharacterized protein